MDRLIVVFGLLLLAGAVVAQSNSTYYTVSKDAAGKFFITNAPNMSGIATAVYENKIDSTGWAFLTVTSNSTYEDYDQMYGAGYLEGSITRDLIWAYYNNILVGEYNSSVWTPELNSWLESNLAFMQTSIKTNATDPYWQHISLILTQLDGIIDGYNAATTNSSEQLSLWDFLLINMDGDMEDLMDAVNVSKIDWNNDDDVMRRYVFNTHCSSLVKVADDFSDIFAGHTTWEGYYEMVRIFKTYNLPISVAQEAPIVMFSGYPGSLSSVDDFYQTNAKLFITETTNGIMNDTLYKAVVPTTVLSFIRVIVANKMASSGQEWVDTFSKFNSGTYNNQWIVVDMKKLVPGVRIDPGTIWILEQIPGYIESADVTGILQYGYWPSYNVPYFPYIYNVSGFPYYAEHYGTFFTYQNNPRAEIFRRYGPTVASLEDIQWMLRYNDYKHDALQHDNPAMAISSRFDLLPSTNWSSPVFTKSAFGGVDSKVTSYTTINNNLQCYIQSGPSHDNTPAFEWDDQWEDVPHAAMPKKWDFDWVSVDFSSLE